MHDAAGDARLHLSRIHIGNLSPNSAAVTENGDYSRLCGYGFKGLFPLRLRVALHGERYRDADSVSIFLATQRHATATRSRNGNRL